MLLLRIRQSISIIVMVLICSQLQAQIHTTYNFGSIGNLGSTAPIYTGSIVIDGSECFSMANGVKPMKQAQTGVFTSNCILVLDNNSGIKLIAYPNPVVASFFYVKTADNIQVVGIGKIQLELFTITGSLTQTTTTDINQLNIGYKVDMHGMANGVYYLKVLTGVSTIQLIKIIKTS